VSTADRAAILLGLWLAYRVPLAVTRDLLTRADRARIR
jgi:hypothetical protein